MASLRDEVLRLIREENIERAKAILEENTHLYDSISASKYTLLHHCAVYDNVKMAQFLLDKKKCYVDPQDSNGRTPLMISVLLGSPKVAYILLRAGANIDTLLDNRNESVLNLTLSEHAMPVEFVTQLLAQFQGQFDTSEETALKLMDAGCHLYQAVCLRDVRIIEMMLDRGYSVDSMHPMDEVTALHFAVYFEDVEMVRLLLSEGADTLATDRFGRTPLFYLYHMETGHNPEKLEILKIFLDLRVSTTACTFDGIFQVANTLVRGNREALRLVLQSCSDFTVEEKSSGKTMLHCIAGNKNVGVIEELKLHIDKFDVNALDNRGRSPLYWSSRAENLGTAEFLLQQGAAVNSTRHLTDNLPPLYYAYSIKSDTQSARFIELLLRHGEEAQFIFTKSGDEDMTIFDVVSEKGDFTRLKIIVAHLAMIEQLGTPITEITWSKINSQPRLREYFNECRQILRTEIWGTVTVLKLLNGDKRKIALYLNQEELNLELKSFCRELKSSFPYYYHIVRKSLSDGRSHKTLKDKAASILCKIAKNSINVNVNQIMGFLNYQDLRNLRLV